MTSRLESAAETRRALLDAAAELLDEGGPEAVTFREVGSHAGVSRAAPYRHFPDKEGLLTAVAVEGWDRLAEALGANGATDSAPSTRLEEVLMTVVELGRKRPHLYQLMLAKPKSGAGAGARAASRAREEFLSIVASVVGEADAQHYGALLFSCAHGIAEIRNQRAPDRRKVDTAQRISSSTLVVMIANHHPARPSLDGRSFDTA